MGLSDRVKKQALGLSQRAMERLFADEARAMRIAQAIGTVQKGRQALSRGQDSVLRQLSLAPKGELKEIGRQLSALRRRIRTLDEKLDRLE